MVYLHLLDDKRKTIILIDHRHKTFVFCCADKHLCPATTLSKEQETIIL